MSATLKQYLVTLENALKVGNATEHTHRTTLKLLLESLDSQITATNEPKRIACGAPDYILTRDSFTIGYIEAKDVGKSLGETERTDQMKRYLRALNNLILTDYLEFRWYVNGELRQTERLATLQSGGKLKPEKDGLQAVEGLLQSFLTHKPQRVSTPRDLAERMARLTHIVRDIIVSAFETEVASDLLLGWRDAFAEVLIADLNQPEKTADFADMFAQTLAYGLFTARVMDKTPATFTRHEAQYLIPKSNPFLRDFFIQITGPQLDDEPFASFVDDLVNLLANTDMSAVLADFGRRTRQEDPVVHFYETFLAAYDPQLREKRGVYYTPEPAVSYIVRSVDYLLKTYFDCPDGLADSTEIAIKNYDSSLMVKGKRQVRKKIRSHKVLVLDPATGTGTFPYAVIDHIRQQFIQRGDAGMWSGYVKNHLLPRLFGFELLMAPYAVAHFKLSLQLAGRDLPPEIADQWAYYPEDGERLGIYLTNSLEEPHEQTGLPLFTQWVSNETNAANEVKRFLPVLVVMGNPPYSGHSANKGNWIDSLLKGGLPGGGKTGSYYEVDGKPLGERNSKWLQDDYVKFIRFGQWRIEQSGSGILAFITNHGYLDNPTFRGMRQSLMKTFTDIYILDLHGNSKKREATPDGSKDENVFDIQQGVAVGIFVKRTGEIGPAKVYRADFWGTRGAKYERLSRQDVSVTEWDHVKPQPPFYLFASQDIDLLGEYSLGWKITDAIPVNALGFQTHRDHFAIAFDYSALRERIEELRGEISTDREICQKFNITESSGWSLGDVRSKVRRDDSWQRKIVKCAYRPFDWRTVYFDEAITDRPRRELKEHVAGKENLCINTVRQTRMTDWRHALVSDSPAPAVFVEIKDGSSSFPLYLYPTEDSRQQRSLLNVSPWAPDEAHGGRTPNLNPDFVADMERKLGLTFIPSGNSDSQTAFGPEDIFNYIYAIFHNPTYRTRYAEFLKIDFPRVPLTPDVALFRHLCALGKALVGLHLLESPEARKFITRYPVAGDNRVEKGYPRYSLPTTEQPGRVCINQTQYFEGVTLDVWEFQIGGYQPAQKWLKDRIGRQLSYDDLTHYQQMVVALQGTAELMGEIDRVIPEWPMQLVTMFK